MASSRYQRRAYSPRMFLVWHHQWYYTDTGIPRMRKIQADDPTIDVSPCDDPSCTHSIKRVEVTKGMQTLRIHNTYSDAS
jgi:hypothetical protein